MHKIILGIDEVGRGPYAGPLVIGACILPQPHSDHPWINDLTDSKKLSEKKRKELYEKVKQFSSASATGWVSSQELDKIGLSMALRLATRRAVTKIRATKTPFTEIIIDGISNFLVDTALENYVTTLKKADFLIKEVSAASIIAKVERDLYMKKLAKKYPEYGFEKHVGYGTAYHQKAMEKFGLTPEHRRSFTPVKKLESIKRDKNIEDQSKKVTDRIGLSSRQDNFSSEQNEKTHVDLSTKQIGDNGESKIVSYLEDYGHEIIARNYKTKLFEIDIISKKDHKIFFTEVKTRKNSNHGTPKEMIDQRKLTKMQFAANSYIKMHKITDDFKLAVGTVEGEAISWFELD